MRLFSTPKTSPELVRHAIVQDSAVNQSGEQESKADSMPPNINGSSTPPRTHSPSLVRGVSTLGRKFSRRFEKFGDSETARRLRMASPSRNKYQFNDTASQASNSSVINEQKKSVSRVDSFRNFFLTTATTTLKTPRAVKRRSRNADKNRIR